MSIYIKLDVCCTCSKINISTLTSHNTPFGAMTGKPFILLCPSMGLLWSWSCDSWFTTTCAISAYQLWRCELEPRSRRGMLDTTLCDKVFSGFLWALRFSSPIKLTARYNWNIVESCAQHHNPNPWSSNHMQKVK